MALKRNAVRPILMPNDKRRPPIAVPRRVYAVFCHQEQRQGAVHSFLHIFNPVYKRILFTDQRRDQLRHIDLPVCHLLEMGVGVYIQLIQKRLIVVYLSDSGDGKASELGTDEKRLRLKV